MSMFTLAISCLTTSNLPWFMGLTSRFLCNIVLYTIGLYFHHQSRPQYGTAFILALSLHSFWCYFSTLLSSILGTYQPGEFIFQYHIFLPFHTVHGVLKARILKWLAIQFSVDHVLSELSTTTCPSLVALHSRAHSFTELDKAVIQVISSAGFL